jgi:hypothetical protein
MKKLTFLAFFLCAVCTGFCQHAKVTFSEAFKIKEKEFSNQTIAHALYHKNHFFTATNSVNANYKLFFAKLYDTEFSIKISRFDKDMNMSREFELEAGKKIFGPIYPQLLLAGQSLFLSYCKADNKQSFSLYIAKVDENTLELSGEKKICTIQQENVGIFKLMSVITSGLVHLVVAPDGKKLLAACRVAPNRLQTYIIDDQLNVRKQADVSLSVESYEFQSVAFSSLDVTCMVISADDELRVVAIGPTGKKTETRLNPAEADARPSNTAILLSRDGTFFNICASTAISAADKVDCTGFMLAKLDCASLRLTKPVTYQFTPEFIEKISRDGGGRKRKGSYHLHDFVPVLLELEDGRLVVMGSSEHEYVNTSTDVRMRSDGSIRSQSTTTTTTYQSGPIFVIFPDSEKKLHNYTAFPRRVRFQRESFGGSGAIQITQSRSVSRSSSNFVATGLGSQIVVIYNDEEDNLSRDLDAKVVTTRTTSDFVLAEGLVNAEGKLVYRKQIGENLDNRKTYYLGHAVPTSATALVFPVGKESSWGTKTQYSNWCFVTLQ